VTTVNKENTVATLPDGVYDDDVTLGAGIDDQERKFWCLIGSTGNQISSNRLYEKSAVNPIPVVR
jgi:hypothetical protein